MATLESDIFKKTELGFMLPKARVVVRDDLIVGLVKGKHALHLGCVDHPLLEDRLRTQQLLRQKLVRSFVPRAGFGERW